MKLDELIEQALKATSETAEIDFKERFNPDIPKEWIEITKDIVAMANSGGGVIIFGVDNYGNPVPDFEVKKVCEIDPADITNKIHKYTGYNFGSLKIIERKKNGAKVAILVIGEVEIPLVFSKPGTYSIGDGKQKTAFSQGTVYFRHGAKSEPGTRDDLQEVIERIRRKWMAGIKMVMEAPEGAQYLVLSPEVRQSLDPNALPIRFTDDPYAPTYRILDPNITHPYKLKELLKDLNDILQLDTQTINQYDILVVKRVYKLEDRRDFIYTPRTGSSQYSRSFLDWLVRQYSNDTEFFIKAREKYRKRRRRNA